MFNAKDDSSTFNQQLFDKIFKVVSSDPDYFKSKYKEYLGSDSYSAEQMTELFYSRFEGKRVEMSGDKVAIISKEGAVMETTSIFPYVDMYTAQSVPVSGKLENKLMDLQRKFKIPYIVINDPKQKFKGRYVNQGNKKAAVINIAYATEDTPLHEFYHPFVRMLKLQKPNVFNTILVAAGAKTQLKTDEEEIVTDYLAKLSQKNILSIQLKKFLDFIRNMLGLPNDLKTTSTILDVLKTLNRGVDVSMENTLTSAFQEIDEVDELINRKIGQSKTKVEDYITSLLAEASSFKTDDNSVFYKDLSGNNIAKRVTSFVGDKIYGVFSKRLKKYENTFAESQAKRIFRDHGINVGTKKPDEITETITGTDKKVYTFKEVVAELERIFNKRQLYGKLVHSYMQYLLEPDVKKREIIKQQVVEYADALEEPYENIDTHPKLWNIGNNIRSILAKCGLNLDLSSLGDQPKARADKMAPELTIISDSLVDNEGNKLGTTIDGFFQHNNGEVTLIDWKTGNIIKNMNTPVLMEYGAKFDINDSPLNRGYLELAFRAVMLKEKYPDMRFRSIKLVKLNYDGTASVMELNLQPFLSTIAEFYRINNKPLYESLEKKGLFKVSNYEGVTKPVLKIAERVKNLPRDEQIAYIKSRLQNIYTSNTPEQIERDPELKETVKEYTDALLEIEKMAGISLKDSTKDINKLWGGFKNMSDIDNPRVQVFHKMLMEAKGRIRSFYLGVESQHDELYKKAMASRVEGPGRKLAQATWITQVAGLVTLSPPLFFGSILVNIGINRMLNKTTKQRFAFMWRESTDPSQGGYFMNDRNTYLENGVEVPMTPEEIAYRDFVRETLRKNYNSFANEVVGQRFNRPLYRYEILNIPPEMPAGFMPRVPKSNDELREEESFLAGGVGFKTNIGNSFRRHFTSFVEENFEEESTGIPLRYMERRDSAIVEDVNHTWDTQVSFKYFITSMKTKQELDPMYSLGSGLKAVLSDDLDEKGKPRYDGLVRFLDDQITMQILGTQKEQKITTKNIRLKMNKLGSKITGLEEGSELTISQDRILRWMKSGTVYSVMAFKVWAPIRNILLISSQNITQTTRTSVNKLLSKVVGIPPESFDRIDLKGSRDAVASLIKANLFGQQDENKLWMLAKKYDWMPDNRPFNKDTVSFLSESIKLSTASNAFLFYELGENLGALWHLAGLLRSIKIQDKDGNTMTLWDAYNDKGEWQLGVRGYIENADGSLTELTDLTELEIKAMKRSYEKLNGSYRKEEKTAMEATILGDFVMQFHKYFYQYLKVLFASPYKDITVGKYIMTGKKPNGMPVYQWHSEVMVGQLNVLAGSIVALAKGNLKDYLSESSVSAEGTIKGYRARTLGAMANTALWFILLWALYTNWADDDEEEGPRGREVKRLLLDLTRGLNPKDLLQNFAKPIVVLDKMQKLGVAFMDTSYEALASDKPVEKWDGMKTLSRAFPFVGGQMQIDDLITNDGTQEYILGIVPVEPLN